MIRKVNFFNVKFNWETVHNTNTRNQMTNCWVYNTSCNPLPQITCQLHFPINGNLCKNSFQWSYVSPTKLEYHEPPRKSGYASILKYKSQKLPKLEQKRRDIIWFNSKFRINITRKCSKNVFFYYPLSKMHQSLWQCWGEMQFKLVHGKNTYE